MSQIKRESPAEGAGPVAWINHPGQILANRAALNTRAYCSHSPLLTAGPRAAVRVSPATFRSTQNFQHSAIKKTESPGSSYGVDLVFCTPPQWEPPGLQSLHSHGTTALLYRASRRVLNPTRFPSSLCALELLTAASLWRDFILNNQPVTSVLLVILQHLMWLWHITKTGCHHRCKNSKLREKCAFMISNCSTKPVCSNTKDLQIQKLHDKSVFPFLTGTVKKKKQF